MVGGGPPGATRPAIAAVAFVLSIAAAACGGDDSEVVAVGADTDRPGDSSIDLVRFHDVAAEVGIDFRHGAFQWETGPDPVAMMGGGLCWIDYDRDGWLDLYAVNTWATAEWGRWREEGGLPSNRLYRNDAGVFDDVTDETGAGVETRGSGCIAADLDLDGWTDLYVTTERENVLLWNDRGDGFVDDASLADPSGLAAYGWHSGATVGDLDGNGWPDLFVAGYTDMNRPITSATKGFPNTHEPEPDLLFLNDGPGDGRRSRFREVSAEVGIEPAGADYGLGALLTDVDADGDLDLYIANDTTPNQLYENVPADEAPGFRLVEQGVRAGVGDTGAGMGVASGDLNGDRRPELVTTNQLRERNVVVRNLAGDELAFEDHLPAMSLPDFGLGLTGWGTAWVDVDLDADLDLVVANGAIPVRDLDDDRQLPQLLANNAGPSQLGAFVDVGQAVGITADGPLLARGLATADFDNDGDVDIAMGTIGGDLALYRNSGAGGTWLEVAVEPPTPGARVQVSLDDGSRLDREITVGGSYLSSSDPRAHFGLGGVDRLASVTVTWPDGATSSVEDVTSDRLLIVTREES